MKILFFTQYFFPENFRINELVDFFSRKKNKSIVLTTYPSYPNKNLYKKNYKNIYKNLEIIRVPSIRRSKSNLSIILNYTSFILSSFFIGIFKIFKRKFDIIFIFSPSPILSALSAILINKIFKKKVVLWVLDLWPNTIVDLGLIKNKYIKKLLYLIVIYIYKNSDLILAQSYSMKKEIQRLSNTKCMYFPSWPEQNIFKNKNKYLQKINNIKKNNQKILFAGNIGEAQSLETLVKCVFRMKNLHNLKFILIGDGRWKSRIEKMVNKLNLQKKFIFVKQVPKESIGFFFRKADALYLSLKSNKTFAKTIPGKLQTYMSTSKPIIASISGETSKIIKKANCGLTSKAENSKELEKIILTFLKLDKRKKKKLGKNGKSYADKNFNKSKILQNLSVEVNKLII